MVGIRQRLATSRQPGAPRSISSGSSEQAAGRRFEADTSPRIRPPRRHWDHDHFSEELETFYTLDLENGALIARHRRLEDIGLSHASGDTFTGAFPMINVTFERDADGNVTAFRAGNGRARDVLFVRTP